MKPWFTLLILVCATLTGVAEEVLVTPGSSEWREIFEPPFTQPTELPTDMPLRQELFDQLRPRLDKIAKRPVRFEGRLRAFKNWALFIGRTLDPDGKSMKLPPMDNSDTAALWLRTCDGWRLVDFSGGHSDAIHIVWHERYGVPKSLIGIE